MQNVDASGATHLSRLFGIVYLELSPVVRLYQQVANQWAPYLSHNHRILVDLLRAFMRHFPYASSLSERTVSLLPLAWYDVDGSCYPTTNPSAAADEATFTDHSAAVLCAVAHDVHCVVSRAETAPSEPVLQALHQLRVWLQTCLVPCLDMEKRLHAEVTLYQTGL